MGLGWLVSVLGTLTGQNRWGHSNMVGHLEASEGLTCHAGREKSGMNDAFPTFEKYDRVTFMLDLLYPVRYPTLVGQRPALLHRLLVHCKPIPHSHNGIRGRFRFSASSSLSLSLSRGKASYDCTTCTISSMCSAAIHIVVSQSYS